MQETMLGQGFEGNDSEPLVSVRKIMEPGYSPYERKRTIPTPDGAKHKFKHQKSGGIIRQAVKKNDSSSSSSSSSS